MDYSCRVVFTFIFSKEYNFPIQLQYLSNECGNRENTKEKNKQSKLALPYFAMGRVKRICRQITVLTSNTSLNINGVERSLVVVDYICLVRCTSLYTHRVLLREENSQTQFSHNEPELQLSFEVPQVCGVSIKIILC